MTARLDYLTFLTSQGFTPNRAVLFEEGSGTPVEHYTAVPVTLIGSPTWTTDPNYGVAGRAASPLYAWSLGASNAFLSTTAQTVLIIRQRTSLVARDAADFGVGPTAANRCNGYIPWGNGDVYWDFGGLSGVNRITWLSYVETTNLEAWAFRGGTQGVALWKDGVQIDTQATAVTRTATANNFYIHGSPGEIDGDYEENVFFFALVPFELSDAVLATFKVARVLLGGPLITTDATLPRGTEGTAYAQTFTATGGAAPLTWTMSAGALPGGLTLSGAAGNVLSGTVSAGVYGTFTFTMDVEDAVGNVDSLECTLVILLLIETGCVPQQLGALMEGEWTNNSRVGPFDDGDKTFAAIFRDPGNPAILLANYSTDYGFTWDAVPTTAFTNGIISHDADQAAGATVIRVATQEANTGRVAYSVFSLVTHTWTTENEQVLATSAYLVGVVSMMTLSGGDPVVLYESAKENVAGTDRSRVSYKRKTAGVWSAAFPLGDVGIAQSNVLARGVPTAANKMWVFFSVSPGYSVFSTDDLEVQIVLADNTTSVVFVYHYTGLLGSTTTFQVGDYCVYTDSGLKIANPSMLGGSSSYYFFDDATVPANAFLESGVGNFSAQSVFGSKFPKCTIRFVNGVMHSLDFAWDSLSGPSYIRYKSGGPTTFPPADMADQFGPQMGTITGNDQEFGGNVVARTGSILGTYINSLVGISSGNVKYEWMNINLLPTDPTLTLAQWLIDLETQVITFDCGEVCIPIEDCEYDHITFAQLKTQLAARLGDTGKAFWVDTELGILIQEAMRTFGLLSGFWRDRGSITSATGVWYYDLPTLLTNHNSELILEYTVTDRDLVQAIQYHLLESAASQIAWGGTEMFTLDDIRYAMQRRRDQFLADTGIVVDRIEVVVTSPPAGRVLVGRGAICLDQNIIDVRRAAWQGLTPIDYYTTLWREDERLLTAADSGWSNNPDTPAAFSIMATPPLELQLAPPPIASGVLELLVVQTGASLDPANTDTVLGIPDDLTPAIKWGALADLLSKDGPARDPQRAQYCEQFYYKFVELARLLPVIIHAEIASLPLPEEEVCTPADLAGESIIPVTIQEIDSDKPQWENQSSAALTDLLIAGPNLIGISPVPVDELTAVLLDVVRKTPVPVVDADTIQLGKEQLDMIIDYAEHLALFKVGGAEFQATLQNASNFLVQSLTYNQRISASALAVFSATEQSQREKQGRPRRRTNFGIGTLKEIPK